MIFTVCTRREERCSLYCALVRPVASTVLAGRRFCGGGVQLKYTRITFIFVDFFIYVRLPVFGPGVCVKVCVVLRF